MKKIPVMFSNEVAAARVSFSPSSAKPALAVRSWKEHGYPIEVKRPRPVERVQLKAAHDPGYVDRVLDCEEENGFGTLDASVARSLPWTSGAMLSGAIEALKNGKVACAPVSGFHHAGYTNGGGFCTFNGLMVTAIELLESGLANKVGIIDYDQHYGDGTDNIIRELKLDKKVKHFTYGKWANRTTPDGKRYTPEAVVDHIPTVVEWMKDCGVSIILFQAGADPHENDPLGGRLPSAYMEKRDRLLFESAKKHGIPCAWVLAGGYQEDKLAPVDDLYRRIRPVLDIHDTTMRVCAEVYCE